MITITRYEPLSIISASACIFGFFITGVLGMIFLIIGALLMAISYEKVKEGDFVFWPLYVSLIVVGLKLFIWVMGIIATLVPA